MYLILNDPDYLIKSNKFDNEILKNENYNDWYRKVLRNDIIPETKTIILKFLIPYKISKIKLELNEEFLSNPYMYMFDNRDIISPSLLMLQKETLTFPPGYPNWFYCAFPEVAWWVVEGSGTEFMITNYGNSPASEFMDGQYVKSSIIKQLIEAYFEKTGNKLECTTYKS